MPEAVARNWRRVSPCRFANSPLNSLTRASRRRCLPVWSAGMNSSLETLWVGIGPGNALVSAGARTLSSSSLSSLMAVPLVVEDVLQLGEERRVQREEVAHQLLQFLTRDGVERELGLLRLRDEGRILQRLLKRLAEYLDPLLRGAGW